MRSGILLFELLLSVVLLSIVASMAFPRLLAIADSAAVRDETLRVVSALDAARGAAVRLDVGAALALDDSAYRVTAVTPTDTVTAWRQPGPATRGVAISGAGAAITFGPDGLALGVANRTITITRGGATRHVVMSKYGRLTY